MSRGCHTRAVTLGTSVPRHPTPSSLVRRHSLEEPGMWTPTQTTFTSHGPYSAKKKVM